MLKSNLLQNTLLELEEKEEFICGECIAEPFLNANKIESLYSSRLCIGCKKSVDQAFSTSNIAKYCRANLEKYFEIDVGIYQGYELTLKDVLYKALFCKNHTALTSIIKLLEITSDNEDQEDQNHFYSIGQEYQRKSSLFEDEEHEQCYVLREWNNVANQLNHDRRFFNKKAFNLFDNIIYEALAAEDLDVPKLRPVIKTVPSGFDFFRSRIAKNYKERMSFCENQESNLGAPPREIAANNRMSAAGIPHLYLSADAKTCIAEVRPSIGDEVVIGKFRSTKELKIFDLTALSGRLKHSPLSFFDSSYEKRYILRLLLSHLHIEIGRPAKLHDTDYLMTQALAEYIRFDCNEKFDGIAFKSVQNSDGVNYMLFDCSTQEERNHIDWKAKFDVEIVKSDVGIISINTISYGY
ncbi:MULTISPECIES: RES family NAD+ phosphorylase [unclassified Janthinobacterium]|uniref:RES family NAD+ phosphorylase n=1 Tax=unclassified Janthinobacterium TaxID=2610881 RepID=UPI001607D7AE|nr:MULTISPECIES: RES family NAD+ phosphorylase [unclassified Janthinobacterium]MBB5609348.1 hypothetical protein [Janthinobacterium sp. S3T4]MBB5614521.1 hypothetical protein [Janthinobacterium sp. S3M3]